VSANNERGELLPGMTANVRIVTDTREAVLKAPNAALRFRPPGEGALSDKAKADARSTASQAADGGAAKGGAGAGGQMTQFRERLVTELKLDAEQQQRLEPILAEMRNKMMGLRDLPEDARAKQGAAIRADMRARVEEVLKPEQKARYAELITEMGGRAASGQSSRGRIHLLQEGKPRSIEVRVGLSDGAMSEVSGAEVAEGAEVVIGLQGTPSSTVPAQKSGSPRMPF